VTLRIIVEAIVGITEGVRFPHDTTHRIWIAIVFYSVDDYVSYSLHAFLWLTTGLKE
jgi:hypothetical protein